MTLAIELIIAVFGFASMLVIILLRQAKIRGVYNEKLAQMEATTEILRTQADIANRADVDRDELYARMRGQSKRFVPTVPTDDTGSR